MEANRDTTNTFSKAKNPEQQPVINPSPTSVKSRMKSVKAAMASSMGLTRTGDHSGNQGE